MTYITALPLAPLTPFVEAYWQVVWEGNESLTQRILPDGCVDVILNIGAAIRNVQEPAQELAMGSLHLVGTLTRPVELAYSRNNMAFGIRFRPAGLARFARVPMQWTQDATIEMVAFAPSLAQQLMQGELPDATTFLTRCRAVNKILSSELTGTPSPEARRLWHAVQQFEATAGQLRVGQAAELACLSERQFERRFAALVGVKPKQLAELIRFRATCQQLRAAPTAPLEAVALEMGYYDAAHLTRAFSRYAGQTPASYRP